MPRVQLPWENRNQSQPPLAFLRKANPLLYISLRVRLLRPSARPCPHRNLACLFVLSQPVRVGAMDQMDALAKLYPQLTPEELVEAKENLDRYLLLVWEIWEDEQKRKASPLTQGEPGSRIKAKVDSP